MRALLSSARHDDLPRPNAGLGDRCRRLGCESQGMLVAKGPCPCRTRVCGER